MRDASTHTMPKWPDGAKDFTVSVIPNVKCDTSYIPKPILNKLGNPRKIRFSIRGDSVVVEGQDQ